MHAPTHRRIVPTPILLPTPSPNPSPTTTPAHTHVECATETRALQALVPLDKDVRAALEQLKASTSELLASPFVPDEDGLVSVEQSVRHVRIAVAKAQAEATASRAAVAAEHERLAETLKPVKIERTTGTKTLYKKHKAAMGGDTRALFRCPCSNPTTGVCAQGNSGRPSHPAARARIQTHINRWHLNDPLRAQRRSDAFWTEGATESRARAR